VLISHDHYDHWDEEALNSIYEKYPECEFMAGLNSEDVLPKNCRRKTLDWTESREMIINNKKIKVTFVPVCHWSRRGLFDKNYRLWGGFVIETERGKKIFYSGDTGYCPIFKILQKEFNSFDLCILPIGAY
jgi:L-ascorbate metabolism protein UlaG (beta-lactamase superfamily)